MLVREWMTPNPITISDDTSMMKAIYLMKQNRFRRLPVLQGDKLGHRHGPGPQGGLALQGHHPGRARAVLFTGGASGKRHYDPEPHNRVPG